MHLLIENAAFRWYWLGRALTSITDSFLFVALPFAVFQVVGQVDQTALALILTLGAVPRFLGLLLGSLIDRLPLRGPFLGSIATRCLSLLGLVGVVWGLQHRPLLGLWLLGALVVINGLSTVMTTTATGALIPALVDADDLPRANSLTQATMNAVPIGSYVLAGLLIHRFGSAVALWCAALALLGSLLTGSRIRFPLREVRSQGTFLQDVIGGARLVVMTWSLLSVMLVALLINGLVALLNVLIPLSMSVNGAGAPGYGVFEACLSSGLLLGIVSAGLLPKGWPLPARMVLALSVGVAAFLGFALARDGSPVWLWAGAVTFGWCAGMATIVIITVLQSAAQVSERGRVFGMFETLNAVGMIVAPVATSAVSQLSGPATAYAGGGLLLLLAGVTFWVTRGHMHRPETEGLTAELT
ncbi:hypothetical protein DEIPH_ctg139orf0155 [Deinococcus phoenicis]|uniref:MFS transporter n=1 Tax=Deinococcus phoenicis TaxID=1476583 RepID=A0A016QKW3_9DEIO|nr:MFS transporter [Deinococcus phoenicis]EYB66424.1 hypothetical protein DEIPH_ctg139orf0155 [Deinococcus phoenicis]